MAAAAAGRASVHVVWFKHTDLRVHDHVPLCEAHKQALLDGSAVLHLMTIDTTWFSASATSREARLPRCGWLRAQFLLESVVDLDQSLSRLGHRLIVFYGSSKDAFEKLSETHNIVAVHAHGPELCSEEREIEAAVRKAILPSPLILTWGWTLHHVDDLPKWMKRGQKTPGRYKPFLHVLQSAREQPRRERHESGSRALYEEKSQAFFRG